MQISWEFTVLDAVVILGIILVSVVILVALYLIRRAHKAEIDHKVFQDRWLQIEGLLKMGKEMNYKLAIIEADKLLDHALTVLNFPGTTTAERLQFAAYKYKDLKRVWWAHKVRNMVVHDVKYELSSGETKKVVELFRRALKLIGCL